MSNQNYSFGKLRFGNSSGTELNITEAGNATNNWVDLTLKYWENNWENYAFVDIKNSPNILVGKKDSISSWEGVFIYSNKDNITLIRQN